MLFCFEELDGKNTILDVRINVVNIDTITEIQLSIV
jgi:hypothetical protein